jgi:hypothetical protein
MRFRRQAVSSQKSLETPKTGKNWGIFESKSVSFWIVESRIFSENPASGE